MKLHDHRTKEQRKTHSVIVMMTDKFLSHWGVNRSGGKSYAGWACKPQDLSECEGIISQRGDAKNIRIVGGDYRPSATTPGHCHIYVYGGQSRNR